METEGSEVKKPEPAPEMKKILAALADAEANAERLEVEAAHEALRHTRGYVKRAAEALGWYRMRFSRLMAKHPELARAAEELRSGAGWSGGRPPPMY
jgi:DNA-binding NtrC family response regulator